MPHLDKADENMEFEECPEHGVRKSSMEDVTNLIHELYDKNPHLRDDFMTIIRFTEYVMQCHSEIIRENVKLFAIRSLLRTEKRKQTPRGPKKTRFAAYVFYSVRLHVGQRYWDNAESALRVKADLPKNISTYKDPFLRTLAQLESTLKNMAEFTTYPKKPSFGYTKDERRILKHKRLLENSLS